MAQPHLPLPWRHPLDAFHPLRDMPFALLCLGDGEEGRWSAIFAHPRSREVAADSGGALSRARIWLEGLPQTGRPSDASPFRPGIAGVLGYDAGCPQAGPPSALGLYDRVLVFDHEARRVHMVETPDAAPEGRASLLALLDVRPPPPPLPGSGCIADVEPRANFGGKVEAVRARIACGEFYQANISRRFEGRLGDGDHPFDLFRRLARSSPAAFAAYLRLPGCAIVSNSPERLVRVRNTPQGRLALTSPIKGTAPRGSTPEADALNARGLLASEKDRAENLMIVDLMRNDLSRACRPGSVRTPRLFELSTLPNVHHLVSHVEGVLEDDRSAIDLLEACFPAGSITGAPKRRAMDAIRQIEGSPRGADYGSLFRAAADGEIDSSVLIRTATCRETPDGWAVAFRVGCGITTDSDPEAETLETEAKAQRLLQAICGPTP
ncbi:MAG: anthranilate synthase component I family protein [Phenylobacterium sp.]|nr:anthranilate synthase component I family protein [Phenylobacterium sp.]